MDLCNQHTQKLGGSATDITQGAASGVATAVSVGQAFAQAGAVIGTAIPIPIIGTAVGLLIGAAIGALVAIFKSDNSVIHSRDKVFAFIREAWQRSHNQPLVLNDGDKAFANDKESGVIPALKKKYNIAQADIKNVGTASYFKGVAKRVAKAATDYITNNAPVYSKALGVPIHPEVILTRFAAYLKKGQTVGDALYSAFTGDFKEKRFNTFKVPNDIVRESAQLYADQINAKVTNQAAINAANAQALNVADQEEKIVENSLPKDAEGNAITPEPTEAGINPWVAVGIGTLIVGGLVVAGSGRKKK